jgi:uncharacterized membrane protein (UPF0127 family)
MANQQQPGKVEEHTMKSSRLRVSLLLLLGLFSATATISATVSSQPDMAHCGSTGMARLPDGANLRIRLALSDAAKTTGLSGTPSEGFRDDEALLMVFPDNRQRAIHMPDTYFNLDVFFLDDALTVVGLQRNLPAHPGKTEPPVIAHSKWVYSRHILELRSGTTYANQIKRGTRLTWTSKPALKEIEECMADAWKQIDRVTDQEPE